MKTIRYLLLCALALALCASLAGCFNSANQPAATPAPSADGAPYVTTEPTPMSTPGETGQPSPGASPSAAKAYDWAGQGTMVESRVNMFSEVQECRVVTSGNTALVGVTFTGAYQGEMTQRIRDMIAGEVMAADTAIQVVAVTAEPEDVKKIAALSDRQRAGATPQELKSEVDSIAKNATTLR